MLEQVADLKRHRFGRASERHENEGQISFMEVDGEIVFFNEAEAIAEEEAGEAAETAVRQKPKKRQGKTVSNSFRMKCTADMGLPRRKSRQRSTM